ncbi:MAG: alpha/beta fold hydrolase [Edaphobacter sp.]|uniref:alpha/beta fold hydrolase n=1 Tax=Edaphobacter sp. TaxID=1934404 RepID=UPI002383CA0B|nr:alpha/beta fold hydrolase [Edaphobacter sp.]MDE1175372.1 alpha/beta fold hydrolase [Edaphobacter sp.]
MSVSRMERGFVSVAGARLHYLKSGEGRPLILLHGLVGSAWNWKQNIRSLASHATVYAIDLPNMGDSDRSENFDASLEATADAMAACMDALGLEQADVAGHSHGGAVSMMLAARHPERVGRLILFAPANPYCDLGLQLIRFYQTRFGAWFARQIPWLPRAIKWVALRRMYGDPRRLRSDVLDGYINGLSIPGTIDHVLNILHGWEAGMERLRTSLEQLADKPILLIWGDRDHTVGLRSARDLGRVFSRSSLVVIPGVGHIPFQEMPEICNRAMTDWLSTPKTA